MKTLKLSLLALSVISIAACSGGGGSSKAPVIVIPSETTAKKEDVKPKKNEDAVSTVVVSKAEGDKAIDVPNTNTVQPTPSVTTNPSPKPNPSIKLENGNVIDKNSFRKGEIIQEVHGYGRLSGYNRKYSFNGAWVKDKSVSDIEVEGKNIILSTIKDSVGILGGLQGFFLDKALGSAINWTSSQYSDPEREIFYFGDETKNIPTYGTFTYRGNATRYDNLTKKVANIGKSELTADFSHKRISGELAMDGLRRNISLKEAHIIGNGFRGKAVAGENSLFSTREGTYEGKFFGPNAEEVAGKAIFDEARKDLNTSFSAEKGERLK